MAWINLLNLGRYHEKIKAWIEENKYVHPFSHPATMIVQDNLNQFVTKDEKTTWNKKLDADANAVSASKLLTPVNINGIPFDGTKDIEINHNIVISLLEKSYITKLLKHSKEIIIPDEYLTEEINASVFIDGIKLLNSENFYRLDVTNKKIILVNSYEHDCDVEIIFKTISTTKIQNMTIDTLTINKDLLFLNQGE